MVNKEPLCLCMWWSCWYSFNSRRLIEVKSILSLPGAGMLLADKADLRLAGSSAARSYRGNYVWSVVNTTNKVFVP